MWQELNETNQAGSGDDFLKEKLQRIKVFIMIPLPFCSFPFGCQG